MTKSRAYSTKDVEMLIAAQAIAKSFNANISDLSVVRLNWTLEYASDLISRIDQAIEDFLGLDKKKELREATAHVESIQTPALRDLSFFKKQIIVDFNGDANEVLKLLGYTKYLQPAQKRSQEALIELLYSFKSGMTDDLKAKIVEKGTNPALIDRISGYASKLNNANVSQESLKGTSKTVSEEASDTFNGIYKEIIGICKIASSYYSYDSILKEQFTFSKVIANMHTAYKEEDEATE